MLYGCRIFIANSAHEINELLQELEARSKEVGIKTNATKTRVMGSFGLPKTKLRADGADLEEVEI